MRTWTEPEIRFLAEHRLSMTNAQLGEALGRTEAAVRHALIDHGLARSPAQVEAVRNLVDRAGSANGNWQGGISKLGFYQYQRVDRQRHPERHKARVAVYQALKRGLLKKGACEVCGAVMTHAHHQDYTKPLQVRWLCRQHHNELHRRNDGNRISN